METPNQPGNNSPTSTDRARDGWCRSRRSTSILALLMIVGSISACSGTSSQGVSSSAATTPPSTAGAGAVPPSVSPPTQSAPVASAPTASDLSAGSSCTEFNAFLAAYGPKSPDPSDPGLQAELGVLLRVYHSRTGKTLNSLSLLDLFGVGTICMQSPSNSLGETVQGVVNSDS
jgi:hypothetical protein